MSWAMLIEDAEDLRFVRREDFDGEVISAEEFDHMLRVCGGLWLHNGNPAAPHAELTSGKCSDGFVDTLRLLKYPNLTMLFGEELARIYRQSGASSPDWIIGSDHAAATLSFAVAYHMQSKHAFTEKGPDKTQLWKREVVGLAEIVLQVEELVTTTTTLERVRAGIIEGNPSPVTFADASLTLVHRSSSYEFDERPILHFRHYDIAVWEPEDCPLCAAGSPRLRLKQNWAALTAV
jgi:hypothetical protein